MANGPITTTHQITVVHYIPIEYCCSKTKHVDNNLQRANRGVIKEWMTANREANRLPWLSVMSGEPLSLFSLFFLSIRGGRKLRRRTKKSPNIENWREPANCDVTKKWLLSEKERRAQVVWRLLQNKNHWEGKSFSPQDFFEDPPGCVEESATRRLSFISMYNSISLSSLIPSKPIHWYGSFSPGNKANRILLWIVHGTHAEMVARLHRSTNDKTIQLDWKIWFEFPNCI